VGSATGSRSGNPSGLEHGHIGSIILRPATFADAALLLAWRNDPQSRLASRNTALVQPEEHTAWLSRTLASGDRKLMIAESGGKPAGVVRADRIAQGWELSWTVAPEARGRGVGSQMLVMFVAGLEGRLHATIRKDNGASRRMALAAGLSHRAGSDDPDFEEWVRE
jgi:UDP-2,4-diacetamido-2,4,6-trideoxy-beta-L-altropyranose hydrolase